MLTKTEAYRSMEKAGYNPLIYAYLSTNSTRRLFTLTGYTAPNVGTGFWDGTRYVGDGGTFGAAAGVTQSEALLLSISPISQTTAQSTRGLLTSLSASAVGHVSISLDNTERFFTDIVSGEAPEQFENYGVEIRQGFEGLDYGDQLSLFRGVTMDTELTTTEFRVSADAVSSTLYDVWEVPKSGRYSNPENDNAALPLVLGDCTENSPQGVIVCPQIDTVNDVYALACHAIQTVAGGNVITLYDNDGEISSSEYAVTVSGDYESQGIIAYVTFSTPPSGTVTAKFKGAVDASDNLLTNPVDCIEKMLSIMGDSTPINATSKADESLDADEQGYTCAGIVIADNPKAYWLADIMASFLGSWFLNEEDELVLQFDTGTDNYLATSGDLLQAESNGVSLTKTRDNVITRAIVNYAFSAAKIDLRYKSDALTSYIKTYSRDEVTGDISQELSLNWTRNTDTAETIAARIETIYTNPLPIYTWKEQGFQNIQIEPGDYISFSWDYQNDDDGNPLQRQVGRVFNVVKDISRQGISVDFYDTRDFLLASPCLWSGTRFVGDGYSFGGERAGVIACDSVARATEELISSETVLLIHSNTTDGSTTFIDSSPNAHTVVANGTTTHSTDTAVFGTTSVKVWPGWLSIASHADFFLDGSDFTIDFWADPVSYAINGDAGFIVIKDSTNFQIKTYNGNLYGYFGLSALGPYSLTESAWTHIAGVRYGNTFTLYAGGVAQGSLDCTGLTVLQGAVYIGYNYFNPVRNLNGYFDEIRIVNGTAAWTANFTPPTSPYVL